MKHSVINEVLLKSYRGKRCVLCKSTWETAAHHHIRRSKLRIDHHSNLSVLCTKCHTIYHSSKDQFIRKYGEDKYNYFMNVKYPIVLLTNVISCDTVVVINTGGVPMNRVEEFEYQIRMDDKSKSILIDKYLELLYSAADDDISMEALITDLIDEVIQESEVIFL